MTNIPSSLTYTTMVQIAGADISARLAGVSTDPFDLGTLSSGICQRVYIDTTASNQVTPEPEYYVIYNNTTGVLSFGDQVVAVPVEDEDGDLVMVAVTGSMI